MEPYSNPIVLKIHNGTPRSDVNLCRTCRYAHSYQTQTGREEVRCNSDRPFIVQDSVTRCSRYYDRTKPALHEMSEIAWTLETSKGRVLGFKPPSKKADDTPGGY
jgi:hypothetical protein